MGKCLIDSSIYPVMNEHELMSDEKLVYMYLVICPNRKMHGLFEINMLEVAYMTGLNKDRIPVIFTTLQNVNLIHYSNKLVFVPIIPECENFVGRLQNESLDLNKKQFIKTCARYSNFRGETTQNNKAYNKLAKF